MVREGEDRPVVMDSPPPPGGMSILDPHAPITIERDSSGPEVFTHESITDGMDDREFLMNRLGMNPESAPPPPPPNPQAGLATTPPMSEKEIMAKKVSLSP